MDYQPLNAQQKFVLTESTYEGLDDHPRGARSPVQVLGPSHCCSSCSCLQIVGTSRDAFERDFRQATDSKLFSNVFACWGNEENFVGLFGNLKTNGKLVLIGEYAVLGMVPNYQSRFVKVFERYRAFWPGRLIAAAIFGQGGALGNASFYGNLPKNSCSSIVPARNRNDASRFHRLHWLFQFQKIYPASSPGS